MGDVSKTVAFAGEAGVASARRPSTAHGGGGGETAHLHGGERRPSTAKVSRQASLGVMMGISEEERGVTFGGRRPSDARRPSAWDSAKTQQGGGGDDANARRAFLGEARKEKKEHPLQSWGHSGLQASWQGLKGAQTSTRGYPM